MNVPCVFLILAAAFALAGTGCEAIFLRKGKKNLAKKCPIPTPSAGRTWSVCEGPQFAPPTNSMLASGVESSNSMRCTPEMNFEALCCLDYANFESYLTRAGPMTLQLAQVASNTPGVGGMGGMALNQWGGLGNGLMFFEDDALEQKLGKNAQIVTLCTAAAPAPASLLGTGVSAATQTIECFTKEFTVQEIKDAAATTAAMGGNPLLNERVEYFKNSGLPLSSVPLCKETVGTCACNGKGPASASQTYIDERAALLNPGTAPAPAPVEEAPLVEGEAGAGAPAGPDAVVAAEATTSAAAKAQSAAGGKPKLTISGVGYALNQQAAGAAKGGNKGYFSALQTSGSFTMMQAGGFFLQTGTEPSA